MSHIFLALGVATLTTGLLACGSAGGESSADGSTSPSEAGPGGGDRGSFPPGSDAGAPGKDSGTNRDAGSDGAAAIGCPVAPSADPLVVATDRGLVRGVQAGSGLAFLGIPYAKPPLGALRLMPPEPAACWSGVADATQYGSGCADWNGGNMTGSEDCLSLNVWMPALPSSSRKALPVLVWMHGGGNLSGTSDKQAPSGLNEYDGQALATAENVVVVSFNYRVGPLGFLAHPALTASNPQHTSGNYGLLDSLLALQWVQDNIGAFGGDKTRVTFFGQSAGAIDICALVSSPLAHGLFSSALMESGNCAAESLSDRYTLGATIVKAANCSTAHDVVACLQSAPLSSIVQNGALSFVGSLLSGHITNVDPKQMDDLPFGPTVDDYVLHDAPLATIQAGKHNHVPLVIGTNAQELNVIGAPLAIADCAGYDALVNNMFPSLAPQVLAAYPCNLLDPTSGAKQFGALLTDGFFTCPSRRALRGAAATQTEPVYRYLFTHVEHGVQGDAKGAVHASEIPYVFDTFNAVSYAPTAAESTLSSEMQTYWGNVAATGNPSGNGVPTWSAYDPTLDNALQLDTPIGETSAIDATGCNFWDTVE